MILLGFRRLWTARALLIDQSENGNDKKTITQQSAHEESDEEYEKNIKTKILGASLKFVPDLGWSKQAITAGNYIHFSCFCYNTRYVLQVNFYDKADTSEREIS